MEQEIINYLSKYITISKELEEALNETTFIRKFKKGTILLEEGAYTNECYFVIKGCIRSYYIKDGEEKTTEFFTEEEAVTPTCYGTNTRSTHYLECLEDTVAGVGNPEIENDMYKRFPVLESLNRVLAEAIMARYQENFAEFKMASPEERYANLLRMRPDLVQRVPQYQIASYLGITPESLSRIRKRTMVKEKSI
jgi:CRP-like cAMP-binding protein